MTRINQLNICNSDIICGRGKGFDRYVGNQIFRDVIKEYAATYVGYGANRTAKSNTIRKIFETIVVYKNMRFITHAKKRGWVLMEERDIKLKIGHALRDAETVRQKQARCTKERKRSNKEKTTPVKKELPSVENPLLRLVIENNNNENTMPSVISLARSNEEPSLQSEDERAECDSDSEASVRSTGVVSHSQPKTQCCCSCSCQGSTSSYKGHKGNYDRSTPSALYNELTQSLPLEDTSCPSIPLWSNTTRDSCASVSSPLNPYYAPDDSEPFPLSHDFPIDNEDLSSLCTSLEGSEAHSSTFDAGLSAIYLEFMEGRDLEDEKAVLADAQPVDWLF